jgi:hypothetical protein
MASAAVLAALLISSALAVHDLGLFELDRNAQDNPSVPGDDWSTLYAGGGSAVAKTEIPIEDTSAPGTQFQGGGSKDDLDVSQWLWNPGEPLDKDDITNAYAAAYSNTTDTGENDVGDLIIYFGLDRFANNGDAQVGFWFFKNQISLTNTPSGGGFEFSGVHSVGDVLVQSNFTRGGRVDSVTVYAWDPTAPHNLRLLTDATDCASTGADDPACATVNQGDTPSPWPFTPKFGTPGMFPQGSFFEGGINVTRLIEERPCFSTFLAETRTSQPFDARLKDFALGGFPLCGKKSGVKFHDKNADGKQDSGEEGLNGWTINLYKDADGDKILDANEATTPEETTTTHTIDGVDGSYEFPNLQNGDYIACEEQQAGWKQSLPNASTGELADCTTQSGNANLAKNGYAFTMKGADQKGNDFGNFRKGKKSGTKYDDKNANGKRDDGEPGLEGWEIRAYMDADGDGILDAGEALAASATTGADGAYLLSLDPGKYVVCEVLKATWFQSQPSNDRCAANPALGKGGYAITVTSGSEEKGNDFGNFKPPTEGCTPGFWAGGVGAEMWDQVNDPDWTANGAAGTNPFTHDTVFDTFFEIDSSLANDLTMFDLVSTGGGPTLVRRTARMLVAAYLNASAGLNFGFTTEQLKTMWIAFVNGGETDDSLFNALEEANNRECPLPR